MTVSSIITVVIIVHGTIKKIVNWRLNNIVIVNVLNIFNKAWPDIIFANNRILKLKTRAKYEIISIGIKKGIIAKGIPVGKNEFDIFTPWMIIFINNAPIKWIDAKVNVIINELVKVKEKGMSPNILLVKINKNRKSIFGKKINLVKCKFSFSIIFICWKNKKPQKSIFLFKFKLIVCNIKNNIIKFFIKSIIKVINSKNKFRDGRKFISNCSSGFFFESIMLTLSEGGLVSGGVVSGVSNIS